MNLSDALSLFDEALTGIVAPATRAWYRRRLASLVSALGDREVETITASDLRRWRAALASRTSRWGGGSSHPQESGGLSPWTLHGYVRAARRLFRWLAEEGIVADDPARRLRLPPLPDEPPKALSRDEVRRLLEAASASPRDEAIIRFLADTGCRVGGVANLRLSELDLAHRRALLHEKGRGGGRKARVVFFGEETTDALRRYLAVRGESEDDHLFLGLRGPLTTGGIYQLLKRLAKRAGVARFNPHGFRHAWAREALRNGADLATVAQILGHSDVSVTARFYARWSAEELAERHARFSWLSSRAEKSLDEGGRNPSQDS